MLTGGTGAAHPTHHLPQEVGGALRCVGSALAQSGHQHLYGSGGHGEERVITPLAGVVVVPRTLLAQPKGLADGGVQVDGQWSFAGSGISSPGPSQQLPTAPTHWVFLVSGRFAVSQTTIPEAQEHFLTPTVPRDTHLFGGLGLKPADEIPENQTWQHVALVPVVVYHFMQIHARDT